MISKHISAFVKLSNILGTNQDWSPKTRLLWIKSSAHCGARLVIEYKIFFYGIVSML